MEAEAFIMGALVTIVVSLIVAHSDFFFNINCVFV